MSHLVCYSFSNFEKFILLKSSNMQGVLEEAIVENIMRVE